VNTSRTHGGAVHPWLSRGSVVADGLDVLALMFSVLSPRRQAGTADCAAVNGGQAAFGIESSGA